MIDNGLGQKQISCGNDRKNNKGKNTAMANTVLPPKTTAARESSRAAAGDLLGLD
jgi:hypothetical protein